ncbi:heavy-metal-associated domain-containing protein [Pseudomonas sp. 2FG]|uniref:heavy-metal-associated domain-containing protein n=1 Tax=Pseudomonas sp. 2FG TaxID=2502191 RepID=UPI0010F4900E|nr:cation transporter [Pseudomonas sp. 2FG]
MQRFKVQGMSCGHCVRAITQALQARDPLAEVQVDLAVGEVRVASQLPVTEVLQAIQAEGYTVTAD